MHCIDAVELARVTSQSITQSCAAPFGSPEPGRHCCCCCWCANKSATRWLLKLIVQLVNVPKACASKRAWVAVIVRNGWKFVFNILAVWRNRWTSPLAKLCPDRLPIALFLYNLPCQNTPKISKTTLITKHDKVTVGGKQCLF